MAMRLRISRDSQRKLARGAALVVIGGLAAGCSSSASRFGGIDSVFTASTNQRQIIPPGDQPFPAEDGASAAPMTASAPVQSGTVGRSALAPVAGTQVASAEPVRSASAPAATASLDPQPAAPALAPAVDRTTTGTVQTPSVAQPAPAVEDAKGWSSAGGTQITAKDGETVYNLSRRFGVPADVLMKANGLSQSAGLRAGQKVIIPTYVYSAKAQVSAPDNDPNVKQAKSSRGVKGPGDGAPKPLGGETLAAASQKLKQPETKAPATGTYTVADGDTLSKISRKTGVSVAALKKANGLSDGVLSIGQTLSLDGTAKQPAAATVATAPVKVDTVTTSATPPADKAAKQAAVAGYTPPKKAEKVIDDAAKSGAAAPDATGIARMRWPVRGRVISGYGSGGGKNGDGIDIAVPEGTPVKAAENGVVIYAGDGLKEFGNTVLVRHEDGLVTVYGHASELKVSRGEKVKRGQEIAVSGMSGTTDSPKLHFEVRKNSSPVDPTGYLE